MCFHTYRVEQSKENTEQANSETMEPSDDKHNGNDETISDVNADSDASQKDFNYFKQAVKICCGSNFTVAIQPGRYKLLIETTFLIRSAEHSNVSTGKGFFWPAPSQKKSLITLPMP
jgi:hypothetical protein